MTILAPFGDLKFQAPDGFELPHREVNGFRGLTKQRNAILDDARDFDIVVFLDDDFICDDGYLAAVEQFLRREPKVAMVTGNVLADGARGRGYAIPEALALLKSADAEEDHASAVSGAYGCNMALNLSVLPQGIRQFDEALPSYGWLEDYEFSLRALQHGPIMAITSARGVHLGHKTGRISGTRLGYSQIANPLYISRKHRGLAGGRLLRLAIMPLLANMLWYFFPEEWVDRRGRLQGNFMAIYDMLRGRADPKNIEGMSAHK